MLYVSGTTTISIENGVVIHEGAGGYFQQRFERSKMEKLLGQAATLSVLIDNQLYSATDILGYPGNKCIIRGLPIGESSLFWDDVKCEVNFSLMGGAGVLQAVKLELGTIQTLAHQDASGNWVLNDPPPDPALELLKCQRYQQSAGFTRVAFGPIIAGHTVSSSIQIGKMRENPTCKLGLLDIPYQERIAFDPAKMIFICTDRHNISVDISDMEIANRVAGKTVTIVDFFADANL